jgi:uncharacterized repeat protein (TIGR03803 family)
MIAGGFVYTSSENHAQMIKMSRLNLHLLFLAFGIGANIASAQTFVTLHSFNGADGWYPYAGLVQATNGDLYGTTVTDSYGTVFKITLSGTLTTLSTFCQSGCAVGTYPAGALVQATNWDLYGTTVLGGTGAYCSVPGGCGTVFKITPSGTFTTLYSFCSQAGCVDGVAPEAALVQAANGELYGTTQFGGANCQPRGCGTIFKITPTGTLTTLYSFCSQNGCSDGEFPYYPLVQAANGDFYGTTAGGGANNSCGTGQNGPGCGTVFKVTPGGILTTLYSFCSESGCTDGANPYAGLIQASAGYFYGTTTFGGGTDCPAPPGVAGCGTIFKIEPNGGLTTLYRFCTQAGCPDGAYPQGALVQTANGDLYGTTGIGGANGAGGTIFKITPTGSQTTLYSFCAQSGCADGEYPPAGLIQGTNGKFYGTTYFGGADNFGTVFALGAGEAPFVETRPTIGKVGEAVTIVGDKLTGATSVTFNGIPAAFTVDASTAILATVPVGATSGKVQVITPSGMLSSNKAFQVAP